jgi:hypothetical protein
VLEGVVGGGGKGARRGWEVEKMTWLTTIK